MTTVSSVDAALLALDDYADLAADWTRLESAADGSPFTSWAWVSVWLRNLPPTVRPRVFRVRDGEGVLALALLVDAPTRGLIGLIGGRSLLLQETGDNDIDEITIEYAGLLARRGRESSAYGALFDTLATVRNWRSIRIDASPHAHAVLSALPAAMRAFSAHEQPSYLVDLNGVRATGGDYISVLGSSTRSGLRKTQRAYEAHGDVRTEIARDPQQAIAWLHELRELHQRYWHAKGKRGSFASAFFTTFHEDLVREGSASGFVHLMRVMAGPLVVGYLYNLQWRGGIYFYNAGLNYGALQRQDRPGYLAHLAAIEKYLGDGLHSYDFLAGDGDYKRMMSTHKRVLNWIHVVRSDWRLTLEKALGRRSTNTPMVAPAANGAIPLRD